MFSLGSNETKGEFSFGCLNFCVLGLIVLGWFFILVIFVCCFSWVVFVFYVGVCCFWLFVCFILFYMFFQGF